jgi:hypothetical protein
LHCPVRGMAPLPDKAKAIRAQRWRCCGRAQANYSSLKARGVCPQWLHARSRCFFRKRNSSYFAQIAANIGGQRCCRPRICIRVSGDDDAANQRQPAHG